jgi:hypothetical protein
VAVTRRFYLVILSVLVVALAAAGLYLRQRAIATEIAAATCDSPAPPPPPTAPPPNLPGFTLEPGCATGPAVPAAGEAKK